MDKLKIKLIKETILETLKWVSISLIPWVGYFIYLIAFNSTTKILPAQMLEYAVVFSGAILCFFDAMFISFWCTRAYHACRKNNEFNFADAFIGTIIDWGALGFQLSTLAHNSSAGRATLAVIAICIALALINIAILLHLFISRERLFKKEKYLKLTNSEDKPNTFS